MPRDKCCMFVGHTKLKDTVTCDLPATHHFVFVSGGISHYHCEKHSKGYMKNLKVYWRLDTAPALIPGENPAADDCVFDMLMRMHQLYRLCTGQETQYGR